MFIDNNWYGNRFILSRFCKIKDSLATSSIQHGVIWSVSDAIYKRTFQNFNWLVWDDITKNNAISRKQKNVVSIGSPFIYLDDILKNEKIKPKGTLVFPSKSSYESAHYVDYKKLIAFVKKKFKKPYTILVGYQDIHRVKKIRHNFKDCKFVSCGKRSNKHFTDNLYKLINKHHSISIFYVGSPILYSLFLKKRTYFFFNRFYKKTSGKKNIKDKLVKSSHKNFLEIVLQEDKTIINYVEKNYNINFRNLNTKKNQKNAEIALGLGSKKKRKELIKLLGWDSKIQLFIGKLLSIIMNIKYYHVKRNH